MFEKITLTEQQKRWVRGAEWVWAGELFYFHSKSLELKCQTIPFKRLLPGLQEEQKPCS
jgi:hypothetical protein